MAKSAGLEESSSARGTAVLKESHGAALAILPAKSVQRALIAFSLLLISFWAIAVVGLYFEARYSHKHFSWYSIFFNNADQRFNDFLDFNPKEEVFITSDGIKGLNYPAPLICVYLALTRTFHEKPLHVFLSLLLSVFGAAALMLGWLLSRVQVNRVLLAATAFLSVVLGYPFLFTLERGNMEGVVFALTAAAITAFFVRKYYLAGAFIAVAASMKIFPAVLLLLLFSRKRYRELIVSIALFVPIQLISLWIVGPTIPQALASIKAGMGNLGASYFWGYSAPVLGFDHTLFGVVKQVAHLWLRRDPLNAAIVKMAPVYSLLAVSAFLSLYWFRLRHLPTLNQAMALLLLSVTLPFISFTYTLTTVGVAWGLFLLFLARDVQSGHAVISPRIALWVVGLFAFLLSPSHHFSDGGIHGFGGQIQSFALVALVGILCFVPLRSNSLGDGLFTVPKRALR